MARLLSSGPHLSASLALLLLLLLLLSAGPASAQTRLYILFSGDTGDQCQPQDCESGRVFEVNVDERRFQAATPIAHARYNATGPVVTPDGRYLLWNGSEALGSGLAFLSLFDTASRQQSLVSATSSRGLAVPLFAHPSAMRAFFQPDLVWAITVAEPDGSHTLPIPCVDGILSGMSGDGSRLVVGCRARGVFPPYSLAIDSTSGASVGGVPVAASRQASNDEGTALYTVATVANLPVFRRYDVATGAILAAQPGTADDRFDGAMLVDSRTGDLFADARDGVHVLDGATLATVARVASPYPGGSARFVFDPDRPVMYVVWTGALGTGGYRSRIAMIDTTSFATLAEADLPLDIAVVGMVMGPRPPRAVALSSTVTNHVVVLNWTNQQSRSLATGLVVEAGAQPGATNLARFCLAAGATSLSVSGVPSGTYYVRVRAVNGTGAGEPSNEITVVVP